MKRVDKILTGGFVLTMNESFDLYENGAVAIKNDSIVAVGEASQIKANYTAQEVIQCDRQVILPGLINAHTHAPMTLLRGVADDLRLDVWLMGYMMPTEQNFVTPEFCRLGAKLACAEMIRSGVTAFADMYYYEADVAAATAECGLRGVLGQSVLKFPAPDAASYEEALERCRKFIEAYKDHPLIVPALAPHAPYTCTDEILRACADLAMQHDVPLLIHIAEMRLEVDDSLKEFDMTVVPRMEKVKVLNAKTLAAHCVHVDSREIKLLVKYRTGVAHCPTSNLKLASGIPPVTEMLERGLNVGIGTDGPASNNDLDMFEELRLAAILAKGATLDPTVVPAKQALLMATRLGAQAMYIGHLTGSLEAGKRADLIVVDRDTLHNTPTFRRDPDTIYSQVVYATKSTDVAHVMVNGQWLMRDRNLLTVDVDQVMREARHVAQEIDAFLIAREGNVLNKLVAIGGVARSESFEIQVKARIADMQVVDKLLAHTDVQLVKKTHYQQYDTYFTFGDEGQGWVRYREDDVIDKNGNVSNVRTRLTYTGQSKEHEYDEAVLLSRSRFIAPADRPLRFYREYFRPTSTHELQKERNRWHVLYKGVLFYINVDAIMAPKQDGLFLEIKSQTWSQKDAEYKSSLITEMLLDVLGIPKEQRIDKEYLEMYAVS